MWNLFVLLLIWLSELLLRPKCWLSERKIWQEWDSNPRTHSCTRSPQRRISWVWRLRPLGHPAWVYRTCFILSSITLSCYVKSASSCSWFDSLLLGPKCWLFERKIWQEWDSILLRLKCCLFERKIWLEWDSNPRTHSCTRSLKGEFLESGALDRSVILPWVYHTCFILSSITPSFNVKSVCLASLLTLRTPASTKMLAFWTPNLTGVGFEPTHTFVYKKSPKENFLSLAP